MDFLKTYLDDETYSKLETALKGKEDEVKLANLATGEYVSKGKYDADLKKEVDAQADTKGQMKTLTEQIDALKKTAGNSDELTAKIEEIQASNKAELERIKTESSARMKIAKVDLAIIEMGGKNATAVRALLDLENVKLDGEKVLGLKEQVDAKKTEFPYLFGEAKKIFVNDAKNPPGKTGTDPENDYTERLVTARKAGNTLEAIKIKQEAFEAGVIVD